MTAAFIGGLGLGIFLSLSVGPVIFAIIKYSVNSGFRAGLCFAIGVSCSDTMFVVLGNVASSFIYELGEMTRTIGIVGGIVLIGMGLYGLFFKKLRIRAGEDRPVLTRKRDYAKVWLSGYLMNTLNPAVVLFWLGICTANSALELDYRLVLFGTCLAFVLSADIAKVFLADKIRHRLTLGTVRWLNRIAAVSMLVFGGILLYAVVFRVGKLGH
ncbi:LysE family translocator [Compostibacter hankyongensis]|uniref:LysE family translocator n=1 Tax=Compostibacter hankyongensis TaxID=1007089 RepID=A0ABP8FTC6_9BACT